MSTSDSRVIAEVADRLASRLDELVEAATDQITAQVSFYRDASIVTREDLRRSVADNLRYMLRHLQGDPPVELSAPERTGRARAAQGAPLPEVLRAYRIAFAFLWAQLLDQARAEDHTVRDALLETATQVWGLADDYSQALTGSYREGLSDELIGQDRRRSALVAALIEGTQSEYGGPWELARLLNLPYEGSFLVVVAASQQLDHPALSGLERELAARRVGSAWRSLPGSDIAVLSLGTVPVGDVLDLLGLRAGGAVGVSPAFSRLDQSATARLRAQVALEAAVTEGGGVRQAEDSVLAELVTGNHGAAEQAVRRVLGRVLALPEEDRGVLISTAEAWLDAQGSAAEAGRRLYCHENTVRYRLRRLEEHLGRRLDDPRAVAELVVALQGLRTFPWLATQTARASAGAAPAEAGA